jgi:hypothetical protein
VLGVGVGPDPGGELMASQTVRIPRPFVKGRVTDKPAAQLDPQEFADGTNVVWPKGVAVKVGNWKFYGPDSPFASNLLGIMPVQFDSSTTNVTYALSSQSTYIGAVDTITSNVVGESDTNKAGSFSNYLPRAFYNGEVLFCSIDGKNPVLRWAGKVCNGDLGLKTFQQLNVSFSQTAGSQQIDIVRLGGATITNPFAAPGQFAFVTQPVGTATYNSFPFPLEMRPTHRITSYYQDTIGIRPAADITRSNVQMGVYAVGYVGLQSMVTNTGNITSTNGGTPSTATFTGTGTNWSLWATGNTIGQVKRGDFIGPYNGGVATPYGREYFAVVNGVTSDTATTYNPVTTIATATQGVVTRHMTARDAVVHRGRVWFLAPEWAPNRVQVTPSNSFDLGVMHNGEDSLVNDFGHAILARYIEVPDAGAPGYIVGGVSTPGPLLILRSNNVYGIFGNWPSTTVDLIADGAGCVDIRSICSSEIAQGWCGESGIYLYMGGKVVDITRDRISVEWREAMRKRSASAIVCAGMHDNHMIVSVNEPGVGGSSKTWVYNMVTQSWCGFWTTLKPVAFASRRGLRGVSDDLFFVRSDTSPTRVGYLDDALKDPDDVGTTNASTAAGTFSVTSSAALLGSISESARVTDSRITYELISDPGNELEVKSGMTTTGSSAAMGTDTALARTSTTSPLATKQIRASATGGVGTRGKQYQMKLTETGTVSGTKRLAVHEVSLNVRKPRGDAA